MFFSPLNTSSSRRPAALQLFLITTTLVLNLFNLPSVHSNGTTANGVDLRSEQKKLPEMEFPGRYPPRNALAISLFLSGIVLGVLLLIGLVVGTILMIRWRRKRKATAGEDLEQNDEEKQQEEQPMETEDSARTKQEEQPMETEDSARTLDVDAPAYHLPATAWGTTMATNTAVAPTTTDGIGTAVAADGTKTAVEEAPASQPGAKTALGADTEQQQAAAAGSDYELIQSRSEESLDEDKRLVY